MTAPTPKVLIAKPNRPNGVLTVPASATQKKSVNLQEKNAARSPAARLKVIIRRLPPGLTQKEFEEALGNDWKTGSSKVDWTSYKPGKISKETAKPSRPARAYLHLTRSEHLNVLSEKIRNTSFFDAKGSTKDSALLGPPSLEFATYGRIPNGKPRKDARQGTIDQDPDFIDFLEGLTNPISKPAGDQENEEEKGKGKPTVTPLVQFLKEKKANKGKENATQAKSKQSRQESKDVKTPTATESKAAATTASPKRRSAQAVKVEQVARDAVKVLNKQAASVKSNTTPAPSTSTPKPPAVAPIVASNNTANVALADKKRERGNISAAAKILQRDLGIGISPGGRGGRRGIPGTGPRSGAGTTQHTAKAETAVASAQKASGDANANATTEPSTTAKTTPISSAPALTKPSIATQPPTGPASSRPSTKPSTNNTNAQSATKPTPVTSTSTQAFLKHANPSQGVTEPLLEEAFATFGKVNKVEIDPKKGFAYVDFLEPESLQKAIKASPIKVAQGNVQVLERKSGPTLHARNVRGGAPMMPNRGGMPMVNRGGSMRGRGGLGRGGVGRGNLPHVNSPKGVASRGGAASTVAGSSASQTAAPATASTVTSQGPTTTPET